MGLGKTATCMTLIGTTLESADKYAKRPTAVGDPRVRSRATVIICPTSVLLNWQIQLGQHWKGNYHIYTAKDVDFVCQVPAHYRRGPELRVYVHMGQGRCKDVDELVNFDVILTSYATLVSEQSKPDPPFMKVHWFRIVLDEAQCVAMLLSMSCSDTHSHVLLSTIKSWNDMTAQIVCTMAANRRLCITGTPIQNKLEDMFSLLKFLRVKPFNDFKVWTKWIANPIKDDPIEGYSTLVELLRPITMRRMKNSLGVSGKEGSPLACAFLLTRTAAILITQLF